MKIKRGRVRPFLSLSPKCIDLSRLRGVFDHLPHYDIYRQRIRRHLDKSGYGKGDQEDILLLLEDIVSLCTRANLEECYDKLKLDLSGRMGAFELGPEEITFEKRFNEEVIKKSMSGVTSSSFMFNLLIKLDDRLRKDDWAVERYPEIETEVLELREIQVENSRNQGHMHSQVVSEYILTRSVHFIKNLDAVTDRALSSEMRIAAVHKRELVLQGLDDELRSLSDVVSKTLGFLSQISKIGAKDKKQMAGFRREMEKKAREILSLSYLLSEVEDVVGVGSANQFLQNLRLDLLFSLLILPYNDGFRGKYQAAIESRLMQITHYANYLNGTELKGECKVVFPDSFNLVFEGVGALAGKSVPQVVRLVTEGEGDWKSLSPKRWKFYMELERYSKDRLKSEAEFLAILEAKKVLVFQMLQRFSSRSIRSLVSIYEAVQSLESEVNGDVSLPKDVVAILREICHCFSQLLLVGKDRVKGLYRSEAEDLFRAKEQMPQSRYRYRSQGALRNGVDVEDKVLGVVAEELFDALCVSCERNLDRRGVVGQLDRLIERLSPPNGGLLDIMDDPVLLRRLLESPSIKNQSLNRKKMLSLISLSKVILSL